MDNLVFAMPTRTAADNAKFRVYDETFTGEGCLCTTTHVGVLKQKNWTSLYTANGRNWLEYAGEDVASMQGGNTGLRGDINGDGNVSIADVTTLVNIILGKE